MLRKISKRAQTTAEYAILIALVVAAVTAMQVYVKRGVQAKFKDVVDDMGLKMGMSAADNQYEPYYIDNDTNTTTDSTITEATSLGGGIAKTISNDKTMRDGTQIITAPSETQ